MDQLLNDALDIREVVRRTGLTSRALRSYEARGLLKPLPTYSGRRPSIGMSTSKPPWTPLNPMICRRSEGDCR